MMKPYDVRTNKIVERVYHIAELQNILNDITTDYINQVATMTDEELSDDRSEWIKSVGYGSGAYTKMEYDVDIHTLAIEIEQLRRFKNIQYTDKHRITETAESLSKKQKT